jgi:hypothetical protein
MSYYEIDCSAVTTCIKIQILRTIQKVSLCQTHNVHHYSQLPLTVTAELSSQTAISNLRVKSSRSEVSLRDYGEINFIIAYA